MTTLRIESLNCRGIRDSIKRLDILDRAKNRKTNIICLQETHITGRDINVIKKEWNVKYLISGTQRNAKGVMIILDDNFEYKIHKVNIDSDGRYIFCEIEIPEVASFLLVNIYAPNENKAEFFTNLFNIIETWDNNNLILVGDWNTVLEPKLDTKFYKDTRVRKSTKEILDFSNKKGLLDVWRIKHPNTERYTWH